MIDNPDNYNPPVSLTAELATIYKNGRDCKIADDLRIFLHTHIQALYANIPCRIEYVDYEPYTNFQGMYHDWNINNTLKISRLHNDSPLFDAETNLMFRAVHDWHHLQLLADFSLWGEYQTYEYISLGLAHNCKVVLFSEIVLQAAYAIHFETFAAQKIVHSTIPGKD